MSVITNTQGTISPSFSIGKNGVTIYQGTSPSGVQNPNIGDIFILIGQTSGNTFLQYNGTVWKAISQSLPKLLQQIGEITPGSNQVFGTDENSNVKALSEDDLKKVLGISAMVSSQIIVSSWTTSDVPTSITRQDGSSPQSSDILINSTSGVLYQLSTDKKWVQEGTLRGKDGSITVVGIDISGQHNTVKLWAKISWDGGAHIKQTINWPYGYVFKETPLATFSAYIDNSNWGTWDPTSQFAKDNDAYSSIYNVNGTGFDFKHVGVWPGGGGEHLLISVEGEPDYDAMKTNNWVPPTGYYNNDDYRIGAVEMFYCREVVPSNYIVLDGNSFDKTQYPELYKYLGTTQLINTSGLVPRGRGQNDIDYDSAARNNQTLPTVQQGTVVFGAYDSTASIVVPDAFDALGNNNANSNWMGFDRLGQAYSDNMKSGKVSYLSAPTSIQVSNAGELFGGSGTPTQAWGQARMANWNPIFAILGKQPTLIPDSSNKTS